MATIAIPCSVACACSFAMLWRESEDQVYLNVSPSSHGYRYTVSMKSPRRGILGLLEGWLVYRFSLVAELFLIRTVQKLYSFERLRRYNVQLNWVVRELNFCYRRLFARIRRVTGNDWSNGVENNRCTVHLLRELHLSAHKDLVFGIIFHRCRIHLMIKSHFRL